MTPFECDRCVFRKLKKHEPRDENQQDQFLLQLIRRAILDAFWSRARSTVNQNLSKIKMILKFSKNVGLEGPFWTNLLYPRYDHCGYELAIDTLQYSRKPGKHSNTHTQFDTVRKLRSAYGNWARTTPESSNGSWVVTQSNGRASRLSKDLSGLLWYYRFSLGLRYHMGAIWKPNKGFSTKLLMKVLETAEKIRREMDNLKDRHLWTVFVTYAVMSYVLSLQGNEGFMLDIEGTTKLKSRETERYFWVVLLGKLKGEHVDREHNVPCAHSTKNGIRVKKLVERIIDEKEKLGQFRGPMISDKKGYLYNLSDMDELMHELLEELLSEDESLFPPDIQTRENLYESYH